MTAEDKKYGRLSSLESVSSSLVLRTKFLFQSFTIIYNSALLIQTVDGMKMIFAIVSLDPQSRSIKQSLRNHSSIGDLLKDFGIYLVTSVWSYIVAAC